MFIARKKLSYFYNKKQGYHVHKVEEFYYSVDNDVKSLKEKIFNISLSITYSQEVNHIKTKVTKANLTSLSLRGTGLGKITVENSKIDCLYIHDFSSEQGCNLYNIRPFRGKEFERKFEIHESDLDKSWFDNIYFNEYSIISLYRNSYGSTKITSCEFPLVLKEFDKFKTLENIHYPDKIDDNYYRIRYETFLQLKSILGRSDEFYESLRFRAISLNALKEVESLPIWDKIILDINSLSNSHGLSIARPLFWIGIISIIFYILYLMSLGRIFTGGEVDYNLIGYYFSFLDITHRNDFLVSKEDLNSWSMIIDYLNKIVVGFLIFQFVAAFRKYIRK